MLGSLEVRELGGRRSPRRLQEVPGRLPGDQQEDPRKRPGGPGRPLGGPWEALRIKIPPRSPRRPPGNRQEAAKKIPRCPQAPPGSSKRDARSGPEAPKRGQEPPQERPNAAPDANTTKSVILTTLSRKFVVFRWSGRSKMAENWPQSDVRGEKKAERNPELSLRRKFTRKNPGRRLGRNFKTDPFRKSIWFTSPEPEKF